MPRSLLRLIVVALALAAAGCASTRLVHQWSNPDVPAPRFTKIMVIETLPQSIDKDIARYVDAAIEALKNKNLLATG